MGAQRALPPKAGEPDERSKASHAPCATLGPCRCRARLHCTSCKAPCSPVPPASSGVRWQRSGRGRSRCTCSCAARCRPPGAASVPRQHHRRSLLEGRPTHLRHPRFPPRQDRPGPPPRPTGRPIRRTPRQPAGHNPLSLIECGDSSPLSPATSLAGPNPRRWIRAHVGPGLVDSCHSPLATGSRANKYRTLDRVLE